MNFIVYFKYFLKEIKTFTATNTPQVYAVLKIISFINIKVH